MPSNTPDPLLPSAGLELLTQLSQLEVWWNTMESFCLLFLDSWSFFTELEVVWYASCSDDASCNSALSPANPLASRGLLWDHFFFSWPIPWSNYIAKEAERLSNLKLVLVAQWPSASVVLFGFRRGRKVRIARVTQFRHKYSMQTFLLLVASSNLLLLLLLLDQFLIQLIFLVCTRFRT